MGIWIERFVLTCLAAIAGATILTNPWQLDWIQKVSLIVAVAAVALFLGRSIERSRTAASTRNSVVTPTPTDVKPPADQKEVASTDPHPATPASGKRATGERRPAESSEQRGHSANTTAQSISASPGSVQAGRDVIMLSGQPQASSGTEQSEPRTGQLQAAVNRVLRFPDAVPRSTGPRALLETLLVDQRPRKLFDVLVSEDEKAIARLPNIGVPLQDFLHRYYQFSKAATAFEDGLLNRIGGKVVVRFPQGWRIYLRYAILRFGGQSREQVVAAGDFLNYDITWNDAERVFGELSAEQGIAQQFSGLLSAHKQLVTSLDELQREGEGSRAEAR